MERSPTTPTFIFATGIENSCPTIGSARKRVDEMAKCGHYDHWKRDFDLVEELGMSVVSDDAAVRTFQISLVPLDDQLRRAV